MKTEVIMKRELFGREIRQKSKSEMFSATDLVNAGNKWRMENDMSAFNLSAFLSSDKTKEFIRMLECEYGTVVVKGRGRNSTTWVHPFLFIDIALAINPTLKIRVYKWLYDELLKYRNSSGDSYKKMAGAIASKTPSRNISKKIMEVANVIKKEIGVDDWQRATEKQLEIRDKIHEKIATLCDIIPVDDAVEIAIKQYREGK